VAFALADDEREQRPEQPGTKQGQEHVHARFLRIKDLEGVYGRQQRRQERGHVQGTALGKVQSNAVDDHHEQHAQRRREAAHGPGIAAEDRRPRLEQPIIPGRVNVGGSVACDLAEAAAQQRPGRALVVPQAGCVERMEP